MENLLLSEWLVTLLGINYLAYIIYLLHRIAGIGILL